jgi:hypothetical protein
MIWTYVHSAPSANLEAERRANTAVQVYRAGDLQVEMPRNRSSEAELFCRAALQRRLVTPANVLVGILVLLI